MNKIKLHKITYGICNLMLTDTCGSHKNICFILSKRIENIIENLIRLK